MWADKIKNEGRKEGRRELGENSKWQKSWKTVYMKRWDKHERKRFKRQLANAPQQKNGQGDERDTMGKSSTLRTPTRPLRRGSTLSKNEGVGMNRKGVGTARMWRKGSGWEGRGEGGINGRERREGTRQDNPQEVHIFPPALLVCVGQKKQTAWRIRHQD